MDDIIAELKSYSELEGSEWGEYNLTLIIPVKTLEWNY